MHQELLGQYYSQKSGVDFRSLRYPGVISSASLPGGGTTDYAVEIFHAALTTGSYNCFLGPDTSLPFLYMPDCLAATYQLMMADSATLSQVPTHVTCICACACACTSALHVFMPWRLRTSKLLMPAQIVEGARLLQVGCSPKPCWLDETATCKRLLWGLSVHIVCRSSLNCRPVSSLLVVLVAQWLIVVLQTTYNVTAMSFSPAELCAAIQRRLPHFHVDYRPDFRDLIARSWPQSVDDSAARRDWGWQPSFDLDVCPLLASQS